MKWRDIVVVFGDRGGFKIIFKVWFSAIRFLREFGVLVIY